MSEKIVSAGVFTNEKDLSFLPQGIGDIGASFIGPTVKGPAFVPTIVESFTEFEQKFGRTDGKSYVPYAVRNYLKHAGVATVTRILGTSGYSLQHPIMINISGSYGIRHIGTLHPTYVVTTDGASSLFESTTLSNGTVGSGDFVLTPSGSFSTDSSAFTALATNNNGTVYSASIDPNDTNYIETIFGKNPEGQESVYVYTLFGKSASASLSQDTNSIVQFETGSASSPEWDFTDEYKVASTPWIISQQVSGRSSQLMKFHTLSHGTAQNYEFKIHKSNIRPAATVPGSEYGSFTVNIRAVDQDKIQGSPFNYQDTDSRPNILESFANCNLDPNSTNFVSRKIGDKYLTTDSEGAVTSTGDYKNVSAHVRVEVAEAAKLGAYPVSLVPFGFDSLFSTIPTGFTQPISASFVASQTISSIYNKKKAWGYDYSFTTTDNLNYLKPLPIEANRGTGSNPQFLLSNYSQAAAANFPTSTTAYSGSINLTTTQTGENARQFIVPFQGGFDGFKPNLQRRMGTYISSTNTQGFDLSSGADGDTAYRKALATLVNSDQYDINMLVLPGVIYEYHSGVCARAIEVAEDRGDTFYPMDGFEIASTITNAQNTVESLDSNYTSVWFPWVKMMDVDRNIPFWVPPSVVMPGVLAFSDKVGEEWFAPAGLNRGGINEALELYKTLDRDDLNDLYEKRINPITTFPRQGIVVWGQKTLQAKPSALDRISVRRLLITTKKFIASSTRYLVFEKNTATTRNRFLNIVNPYLESIQQRQGLYTFTVKMDAENNTSDIIDRNILYGQLWLQPTKDAEFIIIDFNIQKTGAVVGA